MKRSILSAPLGPERRELKKRQFLEVYRRTGVIAAAAEAIHVQRATVWAWRDTDPDFDRAVRDTFEDVVDDVESVVIDKARAGDTLSTFFFLKAHRPIYRDRVQLDLPSIQKDIREVLTELATKNLSVPSRFEPKTAPEPRRKLLEPPKLDDDDN